MSSFLKKPRGCAFGLRRTIVGCYDRSSRFETQPTFTYRLQQLLELWLAPHWLEARIVSSQKRIIDVATIDGDREPVDRALRHAGHRVALRKKPRKDVARHRDRFDFRCHRRQRVLLTVGKRMRQELREAGRDGVALRE